MALPYNLSEWGRWADKLKVPSLFYKEEFSDCARNIPEDVLRDLGDFYIRAGRENHISMLNYWIEQNAHDGPMNGDERCVRNLIRVFAHLGKRGNHPFSSQSLFDNGFIIEARPDWSKLPAPMAPLAFAAQLAMRFEYSFSEDFRAEAANLVTAAEMVILEDAASKVRTIGFPVVKSWYDRLGIAEHVEASAMFGLMGVLDALKLRYYD